MRKEKLLNWDHEIHTTPIADVLESIKSYVSKFTGWERLSVTFERGILDIKALVDNWPDTLLTINFNEPYVPNEIYGRDYHVGLCRFEIKDIMKSYI